MSLLSELNAIAESCGVPVETGVFSDAAPDTYLVLTPLSDTFDLHADNRPSVDVPGGSVVPVLPRELYKNQKSTCESSTKRRYDNH